MADCMSRLELGAEEIARRRAFYEIADEDLKRLAALRPIAEREAERTVDALYDLIMRHPETRAFFPDDAGLARVKRLQCEYFLGLFAGRCDREYVENRLRAGAAHERVGLSPKWYVGAYGRYLRLLLDDFVSVLPPIQAKAAYRSLLKLVAFDIALAIDTYIAAHLESLARHQTAIRELSTPVIRVHDRALLLPLVGTIDSPRARRIMETVLVRMADEQAKVLIIDIAGVAVVDTRVAGHLLETTSAVRLLGGETIISGIGSEVAGTIVHLGVDLSGLLTRSRLEDALELALGMLGKVIEARDW